MTFPEFLRTLGEGALAEMIDEADFGHPLDAVFHERPVDRYRTYLLVGGMPEAVAARRLSKLCDLSEYARAVRRARVRVAQPLRGLFAVYARTPVCYNRFRIGDQSPKPSPIGEEHKTHSNHEH